MWCAVKIIQKRWFNLTIMTIVDLIKIENEFKFFDFTTIIIVAYSNRETNSNLVHIYVWNALKRSFE